MERVPMQDTRELLIDALGALSSAEQRLKRAMDIISTSREAVDRVRQRILGRLNGQLEMKLGEHGEFYQAGKAREVL